MEALGTKTDVEGGMDSFVALKETALGATLAQALGHRVWSTGFDLGSRVEGVEYRV
jgi:hypothetical protein